MKKRINQYITQWQTRCYFDGIPDFAPTRLEQLNKVPSYRKIVKAIFKNDTSLESLGFSKKKCIAYHELKRIELSNRVGYKKNKQLKIQL